MARINTNWQPIDRLPLFVDLIEKMYCDTQAKITILTQTKDYDILDIELSSIMHVMHRQRENYNILKQQLNIWKGQTKDSTNLKLIDCCAPGGILGH